MRLTVLAALACIACSKSSAVAPADVPVDAGDEPPYAPPPVTLPAWAVDASILVEGHDVVNDDCRTGICRHNENVDMIVWGGAIWLVHRTAKSQILGPNSALHVYRSDDGGKSFTQMALIPAPADRDLRDPSFFVVGSDLYLKALTRLPVVSDRDSNVDTNSVITSSSDGKTWAPLATVVTGGWSFWRVKENQGTYYTAAYQDGDKSVVMYTSKDGRAWTAGPLLYGVSDDTPTETELTFMPSGHLLALVRMDGVASELLGDEGRLRTKVCWSLPPYDKFDCPDEIAGQRLDGPVSFFWQSRLFVIARKHLQGAGKKRTALYEITGNLAGGPITSVERGELPSAGDTSYAGVAPIGGGRFVTAWYSGDLQEDPPWILGLIGITDIWKATLDLTKIP
jgi:hypothetical protein